MTEGSEPQGEPAPNHPSALPEHLAENLDALARDLQEIEALAAAALDDSPITEEQVASVESQPTHLTYEQLSSHNAQRRRELGWGEPDLRALLTVDQRTALSRWSRQDRLEWTAEDLVILGLSGALSIISSVYDTQTDALVRRGIGWLKSAPLLRRWEAEAARLPIDYTGRHFGGPAHRVRSSGHDVMRFADALKQVRTGVFRGVRWEDGQKIVEEVSSTPFGNPFREASDAPEAIALTLKHWAADIVTPMSLPLPGWTLLYEMPNRDLRKFAHDAYSGVAPGEGMNLRSGLVSPSLGVLANELLIRTHVHLQAYEDTGSTELDSQRLLKRTEMLLAGHALGSAAGLTKAAVKAAAHDPFAVRHVNLPALMRTGSLALDLRSRRDDLDRELPVTWTSLAQEELAGLDETELWTLAELLEDS